MYGGRAFCPPLLSTVGKGVIDLYILELRRESNSFSYFPKNN